MIRIGKRQSLQSNLLVTLPQQLFPFVTLPYVECKDVSIISEKLNERLSKYGYFYISFYTKNAAILTRKTM